MMSINIDWEKLRAVYSDLVDQDNIDHEAEIMFLMILSDGRPKKSIIKFKDFMNFFWSISENKEVCVATLVVQDKEGRILYRHKQSTSGNEEIPDGGHAGVVQHWIALEDHEKETYLKILMAQIEGYEK